MKWMTFGQASLEAATRLNLGIERIQYRGFGVVYLSQKTIEIINVSEEPNWRSFMCFRDCSVLSVSCHPAQGSLTEVGLNLAVEFSTCTTVWQQLNYYDASHNQRGCREYRHLFRTGGQGIAVNAQYSVQVTALTPNVWVIWLIRVELRSNCAILLYNSQSINPHQCHIYTHRPLCNLT